ncbi:MAG: DoxX family membrane protein, partial [Tannerella sp.]|nr:DoxX family membrane protein [Tannerella sp.]
MEQQTFSWKKLSITLLRVGIGWHFLYEGLSKLLTPEWTATGYLANSTSFISGFYQWMASSSTLMGVVDILNVYGLILIGLGLFFGALVRYAAVAGMLLLTLYYFAYPPFGSSLMMQSEGSLYIINRQFIEALALSIFVFLKDEG